MAAPTAPTLAMFTPAQRRAIENDPGMTAMGWRVEIDLVDVDGGQAQHAYLYPPFCDDAAFVVVAQGALAPVALEPLRGGATTTYSSLAAALRAVHGAALDEALRPRL